MALPRRRLTRFWTLLLAIVAVAGAVRIGYVAVAKHGACPPDWSFAEIDFRCPHGDQFFYNAAARRLADGDGFVEPFDPRDLPTPGTGPAADHPPLALIVLAPVSLVADVPPVSWLGDATHVRQHRYAHAVLGTVAVLLVGLLGRRIGGDAVGLTAAAIAAVAPNVWVNDGLVMSETVATLTVLASLLGALALRDRPRPLVAGALGVAIGSATLARAELALFAPLLAVPAVWWARRGVGPRLRLLGVTAAGTLIVVGPWVAYNLARFEEPTFVSTNVGLALAGSNCDPVYSGEAIGLTVLAPPCTIDPLPPGDQSEVSQVYQREAMQYARDHLDRVPAVVAARVGRTWSVFRPADMLAYNQGEGREAWVTRLGLVVHYPVLLAAVAGAFVLARRRRRELWVLLVPALVVTLGSAATYGQTRFRAAAEPSLAVLAAVAVVAVASEVRRRGRGSRRPPAAVTATG